MMKQPIRLSLEQLEDRLTPTATGVPWPDPSHLTLSFAPDGTNINGTPSHLFGLLNGRAATAAWQHQILRSVETWASQANINVGVVGDGGQPFGTTGALEGDSRFGDIRIGAAPLPPGTVATGTPFNWFGSTWAGDIILNSNYNFSVNGQGPYDLYTVLLHEAGHVFGLEDTTADTRSAMYDFYGGARGALDGQDVADIQSLYGVRGSDAFDNRGAGNNQLSAASPLGNANKGLSVDASISSLSDADYYTFKLPGKGTAGFTVNLQTSGISELIGTLTVYDGSGKVIGTAAGVNPGDDLSLQFGTAVGGGTYYIGVGHATNDVFGVGNYRLSVNYLNTTNTPAAPPGKGHDPSTWAFADDGHSNDDPHHPTNLLARWANQQDARFQFVYTANLSNPADVDFYRVHAPPSPNNAPQVMVAMVWAMDGDSPLAPRIDVYDQHGQLVPAQVLTNGNGTFTVQFTGAASNTDYLMKVSPLNPGGANSTGDYFLGVNFHAGPAATVSNLASGTLAPAGTGLATLTVSENQLLDLSLSASAAAGAQASLMMTIRDALGNIVASLTATTGQPPATTVVYLAAGTYTVTYKEYAPLGSVLPPLTESLDYAILSDPLGAYPTNPTSSPTTPATPTYTTTPTMPASTAMPTTSTTTTTTPTTYPTTPYNY